MEDKHPPIWILILAAVLALGLFTAIGFDIRNDVLTMQKEAPNGYLIIKYQENYRAGTMHFENAKSLKIDDRYIQT